MTTWRNRIVGYGDEAPDQLLAHPNNWRIHPQHQQDALSGVLHDVGVVQNILVNRTTGRLVDGHLRVTLALRENQPSVPVTYVELSEAEEALILSTLDPLSAMAGTDPAALDALLRDVATDSPAVAAMLDALATGAGIVPGVEAGDDDVPVEVPQDGPTRVQPGEVWRVGRHLVACMDSTDAEAVRPLVAGRKVGMVWADPPYGIDIVAADGYVGGGEKYDIPFGGVKKRVATKRLGTPGGANLFGSAPRVVGTDGADNVVRAGRYAPVAGDDSTDTAERAATLYLSEYPDALHIWWGANNYSQVLPPSTCWLVWDKENTGNFADAELAWCNDDSAVRIFRHMWNGMVRASEHGKRVHPTQKPIALCAWAFDKYGAPGDLILDPFLGSGPSLKAAEKMGRAVVGFELSPHYCDHIIEWAEAEGLTVERAE